MARSGWVVVLVAAWCAHASAHDGPTQRSAALEAQAEADPDSVEALLELARIHRIAKATSSAESALDRAEARRPADRRIALERARVRNDAGDHAGAWAALQGVQGPAWAELEAERARALEALDRRDEAIAAWGLATATRSDPEWVLAHARLLRSARRHAESVALLERALAETRGAITLRLALVEALCADGRLDDAAARIQEVLPTLSVQADWRLRLAEVRTLQGRHKDARRERETAIRELDGILARRPSQLHRETRARAVAALRDGE